MYSIVYKIVKLWAASLLTFASVLLFSSSSNAQYCDPYPRGGCTDYLVSMDFSNLHFANGTFKMCQDSNGYAYYFRDTIYMKPGEVYTVLVKGNSILQNFTGYLDDDASGSYQAQEIKLMTTLNGDYYNHVATMVATTEMTSRFRLFSHNVMYPITDPCTGASGYNGVYDWPVKVTNNPPSSYCPAKGGCGNGEIVNVNVAGDNGRVIDNTSSGCSGYSDFTSKVAAMAPGGTYDVTSTFKGNSLLSGGYVFVDWNNNQKLDDAGEMFVGAFTQDAIVHYSIIPPVTATSGLKRMRVVGWIGVNTVTPTGPCSVNGNEGEVEDYSILLTGLLDTVPSCIDTSKSLPKTGSSQLCQTQTFNWTRVSDAQTYTWSLFDANNNLVKSNTGVDTFYFNSTKLIAGATYRWLVTPKAGTYSAMACDTMTFTVSPGGDPVINFSPSKTPEICKGLPLQLDAAPTNGTGAYSHSWSSKLLSLNAKLSDTAIANPTFDSNLKDSTYKYGYTVFDMNGCRSTDTIAITVRPPANSGTFTVPKGEVCDGETAKFYLSNSIGTVSFIASDGTAPWDSIGLTRVNDTTYESEVLQAYTRFAVVARNTWCKDTSAYVEIFVNPLPAKPTVLSSATSACEGDSVLLEVANPDVSVYWNDDLSTVGTAIYVKKSGSYVATNVGVGECLSASDPVSIEINPIPAQPSIVVEGRNPACDGDTVTLITDASSPLVWSTGEQNDTLAVTAGGSFYVIAKTVKGCSDTSIAVQIDFNPVPAKPIITADNTGIRCAGDSVSLYSNYTGSQIWSTGVTTDTIVVRTSGKFAVTYTDANACSSTSDSISLAFRPLPAKPDIAAQGDVCEGSYVKVYTSPGGNITWSTGEVADTIVVDTTDSYFVTIDDGFGCTRTSDTLFLDFTQPTTPVIENDSVILNATDSAYTFQWYDQNGPVPGATNRKLVPPHGGYYYVVAFSPTGCESAASDSVYFTGVGINELAQQSKLQLYPNPSGGAITIDIDLSGGEEWSLIDVNGRIIDCGKVVSKTITVSDLVIDGIYFFEIRSSDVLYYSKIQIARR